MSSVLVLVIDCTTMGAEPPTSTPPTFTPIDFLLTGIMKHPNIKDADYISKRRRF
jgi:hypothetical protein